jgi:hypothetical protein
MGLRQFCSTFSSGGNPALFGTIRQARSQIRGFDRFCAITLMAIATVPIKVQLDQWKG